jgi:hypothetical protein
MRPDAVKEIPPGGKTAPAQAANAVWGTWLSRHPAEPNLRRNQERSIMSGHLDGRVAVVTGAGRGIGRATAVALAREGADVACVARTASQLAETAALVRGAGRRAQQIEADIGEPGAPSLIAAKVLADLGAIDILVNNAAAPQPRSRHN